MSFCCHPYIFLTVSASHLIFDKSENNNTGHASTLCDIVLHLYLYDSTDFHHPSNFNHHEGTFIFFGNESVN